MATSHFPSLRVTDVMNISETHQKWLENIIQKEYVQQNKIITIWLLFIFLVFVTDVMNISETHIKSGQKILFRKNMFNRIK